GSTTSEYRCPRRAREASTYTGCRPCDRRRNSLDSDCPFSSTEGSALDVAAGDPGSSAAAGHDVGRRPRLAAGFARAGHRVKPPDALSRLRFVCIDESARRVVAAGDSDDHLVFHDKWSECRGIADAIVGELDGPKTGASLHGVTSQS